MSPVPPPVPLVLVVVLVVAVEDVVSAGLLEEEVSAGTAVSVVGALVVSVEPVVAPDVSVLVVGVVAPVSAVEVVGAVALPCCAASVVDVSLVAVVLVGVLAAVAVKVVGTAVVGVVVAEDKVAASEEDTVIIVLPCAAGCGVPGMTAFNCARV